MKKLYQLNNGTHTLHINGFCPNSQSIDYIEFDSEDDALKYAGRSLGMCKTCMEKRDEVLLLHIKNECKEGER